MNKIWFFSLVILFFKSSESYSEDSVCESVKCSLSQHSRDKNVIAKPALIQYVDPEDGDASYSIDAAFKATYAPEGSSLEVAGVIETHKNTLVDKEQNVSSLGVLFGQYLHKSNCSVISAPSGVEICTDSIFGDGSIMYQKDSEKDTESMLMVFEVSFVKADWLLNNWDADSNFPWYWAPTIGLEYEDFFKASNNQEGKLGRLFGNIEIGMSPFFENLDGRLELVYSYSKWIDFGKDEELLMESDSHIFKKGMISYLISPIDSENIQVSVVYENVDGEDPRNKKSKQKYGQIGIGIKVTY